MKWFLFFKGLLNKNKIKRISENPVRDESIKVYEVNAEKTPMSADYIAVNNLHSTYHFTGVSVEENESNNENKRPYAEGTVDIQEGCKEPDPTYKPSYLEGYSHNYYFDNTRLKKYSKLVKQDYFDYDSICCNEIKANLENAQGNLLTIFEDMEMRFHNELEEYERNYGDLIKFRKLSKEELGYEGEKRLISILSFLNNNQYKIINNLLVQNNYGSTSQIDHIVISPYGIFVIETKNFFGTIIGSKESDKWLRYNTKLKRYNGKLYNKRVKTEFFNPIRQNQGHINSIMNLLWEYDNVPYYSVIAFSEDAELRIDSRDNVMYIKDVYRFIKSHNNRVIDFNTVEQVFYKLQMLNIKDNEVIKEHVERIRKIKLKDKANESNKKEFLRIEFLLTLSLISGIGNKTIEYVLDNIENFVEDIHDLIKVLIRVRSINPKTFIPNEYQLQKSYMNALHLINLCKDNNIELIPFYGEYYPEKLMNSMDYPEILFIKGDNSLLLREKKLAIIGSRRPSSYANLQAKDLGELCANNNLILVSLLDIGCNLSTIWSCVHKKGKVILLIEDFLDKLDNSVYKNLCKEIISNGGCIVSVKKSTFMKNDRILYQINNLLAALCKKIIVVEDLETPTLNNLMGIGFIRDNQLACLVSPKELKLRKKLYEDKSLVLKKRITFFDNAKSLNEFMN